MMTVDNDYKPAPSPATRADDSAIIVDFLTTCSACSSIFETPKLMPGCGHTFCLPCLVKRVDAQNMLACPKPNCSKVYNVALTGPEGFSTHKVFEKLAQRRKAMQPKVPVCEKLSSAAEDECLHLHFERKTALSCPHCSKKFCRPCQVVHKEKLKREAVNLARGFSQRLSKASTSEVMQKKIPEAMTKFHVQLSKSDAQLTASLKQLREKVMARFDEQVKTFLESSKNVAAERINQFHELVEKAKRNTEMAEVEIPLIMSKSVIYYSMEEIAGINEKLKKQSEEIGAFEKLDERYFSQQLTVRDLDKVEDTAAKAFQALDESCYHWTEYKEPEFDALRKVHKNIHKAAMAGDLEAVKQIFNMRDWSRDAVETLLQHKDPFNFNRTVVHQAAAAGNAELLRYLVAEKKAKVDEVDDSKDRVMPIQITAASGNIAAVEAILLSCEHEGGRSYSLHSAAMRIAIEKGYSEMVEMLLNRKEAVLKFKLSGGRTLLHLACELGNNKVVETLAKKGIDLSETDNNGDTALHYATRGGSAEVVSYLLYLHTEQMTVKNKAGKSPFDLAIELNKSDVVDAFMERNNLPLDVDPSNDMDSL